MEFPPKTITLHCEWGNHNWERPANKSGVKPHDCPIHYVEGRRERYRACRSAYKKTRAGKESERRYKTSDKGKKARKQYDDSLKGKERKRISSSTFHRKKTKAAYNKVYGQSKKGKEAQQRYRENLTPEQYADKLAQSSLYNLAANY